MSSTTIKRRPGRPSATQVRGQVLLRGIPEELERQLRELADSEQLPLGRIVAAALILYFGVRAVSGNETVQSVLPSGGEAA